MGAEQSCIARTVPPDSVQKDANGHDDRVVAGTVSLDMKQNKDVAVFAKEHFANLRIREYDQIFHSDVLPKVFSGQPQPPFKLPLMRYVSATLALVFVALNVNGIVSPFVASIPDQLVIIEEIRNGTLVLRGQHKEADVDIVFNTILVWAEMWMLGQALLLATVSLCHKRYARTDISSPENAAHWIKIGEGFSALQEAATISAMKALPTVKTRPAEAIKEWTFYFQTMAEEGTPKPFGVKLAATLYEIISQSMWAVASIFALYLKIDSLSPLFGMPLGQWSRSEWLTFIGFANQVVTLTPMARIKKDAFLFFVFTGEDADMQEHEHRACQEFIGMLHKHIFKDFGALGGWVVSLTVDVTELQKATLQEMRPRSAQFFKKTRAVELGKKVD
eukprot:gnl/TRDRNA2_/TRDRNA2_162168_c0_seq1.p1 gnl/TRDRNA2_/TRDRNA2_162168_c0~~gnl/TRDRNA2_/TRDRNA2_162168_c0_seq1.p1  ORF type:complete len:402 (-),score=67.46 gnl/TRDRNA2_/TRDRNA2_162168_c0_seq1:299-1468(-)